jgi:serine protease inhibitor
VTIVLKSSFVSEEVRLTRPFLFYIVDKRTKSVLFAGRLENPNEG